MTIEFNVPGKPVGKGRPRFTKAGHAYTPKETADYEKRVRAEFERTGAALIGQGVPVRVAITAYFPIPLTDSKVKREKKIKGIILPTVKPDTDNIIKIICDALNGVAWHDDSQVVKASCTKLYDEIPRVEVFIVSKEEEP